MSPSRRPLGRAQVVLRKTLSFFATHCNYARAGELFGGFFGNAIISKIAAVA
tara:strand:+ start:1930 stop:2085 length:156 start_codon:yes stop_codon:yes gene_type:complete